MKRVDLIRQLEKNGCVLIHHGRRHDWYQNPNRGGLPARSDTERSTSISQGTSCENFRAETTVALPGPFVV